MSNVKAYLEDIVRDGLHDIAEALKGGGPSGDVQASHVIYDNTESGLTSNRVQGAIDELSTKVDTNTSGISDLGDDVSDLTTRMGAAEGDITSLDGRLDTAEGDITSLDGRLDTAEGDITTLETWKNNIKCGQITITANPNQGTDAPVVFDNPYPAGTNYMVQLTQSGTYALANLFLGVTQRSVTGFTIQIGSSRTDTRAVDIAWLAAPINS